VFIGKCVKQMLVLYRFVLFGCIFLESIPVILGYLWANNIVLFRCQLPNYVERKYAEQMANI